MEDTIRWLIGIVLAFAGVGLSSFYQGKALMNPDKSKIIGKQLYNVGIIWVAIAFLYLLVVVLLQLLGSKG